MVQTVVDVDDIDRGIPERELCDVSDHWGDVEQMTAGTLDGSPDRA